MTCRRLAAMSSDVPGLTTDEEGRGTDPEAGARDAGPADGGGSEGASDGPDPDATEVGRIGDPPSGKTGAIGREELDEMGHVDGEDRSDTAASMTSTEARAYAAPDDTMVDDTVLDDSAVDDTVLDDWRSDDGGVRDTEVHDTEVQDTDLEASAFDGTVHDTASHGVGPPAGPEDPATLAQPAVAPATAESGRSRRRRRTSRRGLRVTQRLWSVDPWSVFKISVLFYLCTFLVLLVAGTVLWNVARSAGAIESAEGFVTRLGAYGSCVEEGEVPEGVAFETDDDCRDGEVLVGGFEIDDSVLLRAAAIGGGVLVIAGSIASVLMIVLLNLLNEVTGGIRHTVVTEPAKRGRRGSTQGARQR
jgi:hypothetical protein